MKTPLRILIVEDSENDAMLTLHYVGKGDYDIEYGMVQTPDRMAEALQEKSWDIILCDYNMPRFTGFEALEIYRRSGLDIPFIIISGTIGEEIAVECMKAGADDYLMKGHLARLLPAIERGLREAKNRSARKRLEAERLELERELIQSQKLESLGTLASGIAHDFNNILAIILGYSDLGERKSHANQPDLMKCFEAISLASRRGAMLVSQLLTFARKTETVFRSTDINVLIREMTMLFGETFPKTIRIATDLREDIPPIVADVTQLHQVFMNLCVNARDAMPSGGTLTISTSVTGREGLPPRFTQAPAERYLAIGIADTGTGMDEKTRAKIFDPFFTTKGPSKGTGLGLALVHSIMQNHKGMIDVESAPGKGTVFRLYLPVAAPTPESKGPETARRVEAAGGSETVLLIEDEALIIDMVQTILGIKGYTVLLARDGEEGVALFTRHRKEIMAVVSDFGLPKMRGDEVARRIKAVDPKARFILISGFFDPGIRSEMAKIGVDRLLQKPFTFSELTDSLRTVIDAAA
jgi:two-component system, cell cycle sensor histidine kinase and response regulator CckA